MTIENLEKGKELVEKIAAAQRLILWCTRGFKSQSEITGIITKTNIPVQIGGDTSFADIRKDLMMLMPEVEKHFNEMKNNYEVEFANLK